MSARRTLLALLLLAAAGCGITPTDVADRGKPPTIVIPPPTKTIYLLHRGQLVLQPANVESDTVGSLLSALFEASTEPLGDLDTALDGFVFEGISDSLNPVQRDEIRLPRTSTLTVYVKGEGELTTLAKAQIVCTVQLNPVFEHIRIVHQYQDRPSKLEGRYTCNDLKPPKE
ncbi:MAG: hypothetical protein HOY71_12845 [Nonomuraea sp.]|nr:hypothetical protein [Nonomuraea sp.]